MGILGDIFSTGTNIAGIVSQNNIANQNLELQKENLQYQKDLQQTIFQREDDAVQRRAADLEAAGLSKTLAAGSAANAGSSVQTTAPQKSDHAALSMAKFNTDLNVASEVLGLITQNANAKKAAAEAAIADHNAGVIGDLPFLSSDNNSFASAMRFATHYGIDVPGFMQSAADFLNRRFGLGVPDGSSGSDGSFNPVDSAEEFFFPDEPGLEGLSVKDKLFDYIQDPYEDFMNKFLGNTRFGREYNFRVDNPLFKNTTGRYLFDDYPDYYAGFSAPEWIEKHDPDWRFARSDYERARYSGRWR